MQRNHVQKTVAKEIYRPCRERLLIVPGNSESRKTQGFVPNYPHDLSNKQGANKVL